MFGAHVRLPAMRLATTLAAVGVVAMAGCSSASKAPASSPATSAPTSAAPKSSAASSPPTSTAPRVPEDGLSSFLLTVDEGNAIMGSTEMQDLGGLAAMDTNAFAVSNPDCLGAAHIVQPPVYSDSGYTAVEV